MERYLIVDDNENDALLLTELIEQRYGSSVECMVAGTREKALWWLDPVENEPFDSVLVDLNLPDSQGVETFRAIYAAARPTPIVIHSGRDDDRDLIDLLIGEGADGYIHKGEANSKQVYETLRDAAQRARYTARVDQNERRHMKESEQRTRRALTQARQSLPPKSDQRLLVEAFAASNMLVHDLAGGVARLATEFEHAKREQKARMEELNRGVREANKKAADADASSRHSAIQFEAETQQLRQMTTANKRKLAALALAIAGLSYSLGDKGAWIIEMLKGVFGAP